MQTISNSQKSTQGRSPVENPSQSVNSSQAVPGSRSSSGSARSSTYKGRNPSQQLSQIEKSVTHLLIATKQLLETLTQWSRHTASEGQVSDVYVRLGYEFNIACRAFSAIGVETADLGPVPELLRAILEETLSQEASPAGLDRFLPRIRDIIITLLHGLKRKQQKLRAKQGRENPSDRSLSSAGSSGSLNTGLTQMLEDVPASRRSGGKGAERRVGSGSTFSEESQNGDPYIGDETEPSSRFTPASQPKRVNSGGASREVSNRIGGQESQRSQAVPSSQFSYSTLNSQEALSVPTPSAPPRNEQPHRESALYTAPPPPPPPKQQDALAALQRGGDLERRASRRYSAYQISKHLGASPNGVPMLPPAQNSPIPNRGRDVRESMNAVRVRGSGLHGRQKSVVRDPSPMKNEIYSSRISEESSQSSGSIRLNIPAEVGLDDSPVAKTPENMLRKPDARLDGDPPKLAATLSGPPVDVVGNVPMYDLSEAVGASPANEQANTKFSGQANGTATLGSRAPASISPAQSLQFVPEQSPQPGKELTLFLQYKSKIKKFVLSEGATDLSIARLQLAFIEKFAWNTHSNGNDLPEIYIQDPVSGVRHELEDLNDVKDRSVLVLNVEALDEVKRHIDEGLGGLRRMVEGVRTVIDGQQNTMQQVSEQQQNTTKELARLGTGQVKIPGRVMSLDKPKPNGVIRSSSFPRGSTNQLLGVQSLRQDLAVVRQTFSSMVSDMNASMSSVTTKASAIKAMAVDGVIPSLDSSTGRSYVNNGKKVLGEDSEKIVNRVDDLQDIVEDLRKDVVSRGVRPLPRQLETVGKSISVATLELKKMQEFLKREKPVWTKIWEKELQLVCTDRDLLTMQEDLAADLEDDLEKATQTFALVEQATKQQNLQSSQGGPNNLRATSRGLNAIATDQDVDPRKAKDGVLGEVRALRPNHETRLEAIERAEKARQKELESRREGEFSKELGNFVEEGKLKRSGGFEEAERLRKAKDERNRREAWEKQQERSRGKEAEGIPATASFDTAASDDTATSQEMEAGGDERTAAGTPESQQTQEAVEDATSDAASTRSRSKSWLPAIFTS